MPKFPTLKTGAITQYPATLNTCFGKTRVVEFLDGSSQRYSMGAAPLRQWHLRADLLDARENEILTNFLSANVEGTFSFTDPFSGASVPRCVLYGPEIRNTIAGELHNQTTFVIEELS